MQEELNDFIANNSGVVPINILGINEIGYGNSLTSVHTLPMLQDTELYNVYSSWEVTYRDVWILNEAQEPYAVVNLSIYSLSDPAYYEGLKNLFIGAALGQSCSSVTHSFTNANSPPVCQ